MTIVAQADLVNAVSVDELSALGANPTLSDLLMYVRDGSQSTENAKHRKVALDVLRTLLSGSELTTISGEAENTTMSSGKRYLVNLSTWTQGYNYIVPAGVAGNEIEVAISTGHASHELVLLGASGVSITDNGVTFTAAEATRLFCNGESLRLYCVATNSWVLSRDNRATELCEAWGTVAHAYQNNIMSGFLLPAFDDPCNLRNSTSDGIEIVPRRAGRYVVQLRNRFQPSGGGVRLVLVDKTAAGGITPVGTDFLMKHTITAQSNESVHLSGVIHFSAADIVASKALKGWYITNGVTGTNEYYTTFSDRPQMTVWRIG